MRVLILLASFNGEKWIRKQIESALAQRSVDVHLVVRDDASTDATVAVVRSAFEGDSRVEVIEADAPSGSAGANFRALFRTVDAAGFDAVALCDQDDVWHPGKLARALEQLHLNFAQGYSSAVDAVWPDGQHRLLAQVSRQREADCLFEGSGQGCTFVVTAALFSRIGDFCRRHEAEVSRLHYHDWLMYLLARAWDLRWAFDREAFIDYRQHHANEIGARRGLPAIGRRLRLIRSGWYARQTRAAADIYRLADGRSPATLAISRLLMSGARWSRFRLAWLVLRAGRRRPSDRLVLVFAALAGWMKPVGAPGSAAKVAPFVRSTRR